MNSLNCSTWSTLEKVSERIENVWHDRGAAGEKVFLLFAVNGTKQYCGLAEMTGTYQRNGTVESWTAGDKGYKGYVTLSAQPQ